MCIAQEQLGGKHSVHFVDASRLPVDAVARFERLFELLPRWPHSDLLPFIRYERA